MFYNICAFYKGDMFYDSDMSVTASCFIVSLNDSLRQVVAKIRTENGNKDKQKESLTPAGSLKKP